MIGKRLRFGRFAANWLSRKAMGLPGLGTAELNTNDAVGIPLVEFKGGEPVAAKSSAAANTESTPTSANDDGMPSSEDEVNLEPPTATKPIELLPKLLRYTKLIFSSRNFFFSYDYDLTRPVSMQPPASNGHLPLYKYADELVCEGMPPLSFGTYDLMHGFYSTSGIRTLWLHS